MNVDELIRQSGVLSLLLLTVASALPLLLCSAFVCKSIYRGIVCVCVYVMHSLRIWSHIIIIIVYYREFAALKEFTYECIAYINIIKMSTHRRTVASTLIRVVFCS